MKRTLVLVTRSLSGGPNRLARMIIDRAAAIALAQDGVYNRPKDFQPEGRYGMPGGHRAVHDATGEGGGWPSHWVALDEDAAARKVDVGCRRIDYAELVALIESHEKIVTL